jgi:hypothetical protein
MNEPSSAPSLAVGDLMPALRHLRRIQLGELPPTPGVIGEILACVVRAIDRLEEASE